MKAARQTGRRLSGAGVPLVRIRTCAPDPLSVQSERKHIPDSSPHCEAKHFSTVESIHSHTSRTTPNEDGRFFMPPIPVASTPAASRIPLI